MNEAETEAVRQSDPVRMLIRLSAVLSVILAVTAGALIWRSRSASSSAADDAPTKQNEPDFTFRVNPPGPQQPEMADLLADFELIDRGGDTVTRDDLLGKPTVVCFIFTHCRGPCPRVTDQMLLLQKRFPEGAVRLVTITVDPERDTPERLANYADNHGAGKNWLFLTKDRETIYPLIRDNFGLSVQEAVGPDRKPGWEIIHSTRVVHVDAEGRIRGKYNAVDQAEVGQLVSALEKELAALKAGQGSSDEPSEAGN